MTPDSPLLEVKCRSEPWIAVLEQRLGPGRRPNEPISSRHHNLAASMQTLVESFLKQLALRGRSLTRLECCCFASGAFMNVSANGRLQREVIFRETFVEPMATDAGL